MALDKLDQFRRERISFQAQIAGRDIVLGQQLIATFRHGVVRCAARHETNFRGCVVMDCRRRNMLAHGLELVRQPVHVVDVIVFALGILGTLVVAAAAREISAGRVVGGGQRAIAEVFGGQHLAAVDRLIGIRKRIGRPVIHAQVEVGHHEHGSLKALGEIEGVARHAETFFGRARKEHRVLRVAVRERRNGEQIALHGACGESG